MIEINPADFITVGTIGPKGQRIFHLQSGQGTQVLSLTIEKEQALALSEAIRELLEDLQERRPDPTYEGELDLSKIDMDLREPIEPLFRVAQMGLGYDEEHDMVVLVAQELVVTDENTDPTTIEPKVARLWCSRQQMRWLSIHTLEVVKAGRADPRMNGRMTYYWS